MRTANIRLRPGTVWVGPSEGKNYKGSPVPPEEWPYGPPEVHDDCCVLFEGDDYCDCGASATDED